MPCPASLYRRRPTVIACGGLNGHFGMPNRRQHREISIAAIAGAGGGIGSSSAWNAAMVSVAGRLMKRGCRRLRHHRKQIPEFPGGAAVVKHFAKNADCLGQCEPLPNSVVDIPVVYHKHIHTLMPAVGCRPADLASAPARSAVVMQSGISGGVSECRSGFHGFLQTVAVESIQCFGMPVCSLAFGSKACLNRDCISALCSQRSESCASRLYRSHPRRLRQLASMTIVCPASEHYVECAPAIALSFHFLRL